MISQTSRKRFPPAQSGLWLAPLLLLGLLESRAALSEPTMEDLSFLAGCWKGPFAGGSGSMEEFYTGASSNLILGTTRYIRQGTVVQYEFTRIEKTPEGILMTPYPGGNPSSDSFKLTSLKEGEAIFEAPQHDYPKRIIYRKNSDGTRTARIDGGAEDSGGQEWRLTAFPCVSAAE